MTRIVGPARSALELQDTQSASRYEFVHQLGRGAMGVVYLVKDRETNEHVALKKLLHVDAESILRLKREFRALSNLSHPNLVKLYDLGQDDESWFLTMEYLVGEDLLSYVRPEGRTMSIVSAGSAILSTSAVLVERLVPAFHQLARGVQALHRAGMLHRDLKPTNVMVDKGRVVVLDFGLVRSLDGEQNRLTAAGAIYGTPAYMAPEQARGEPLREASDWYAFGVMLYEALAGHFPSAGLTVPEIIKKKLEEDPRPLDSVDTNVPPSLSRLCMDLLQRDPARRPQARDILARLERETPGSIGVSALSDDVSAAATQGSDLGQAFFGRETELEELWGAWRRVEGGQSLSLHVRGMSGSGKSTLVEHFLDMVDARSSPSGEPHALVLRSRCYEREVLPFKALDGVMDALVQHLRPLDDLQVGHLLPTDVDALARIFPVMEGLRAVRRLLSHRLLGDDAVRSRTRAEAAFCELLRRLASQSPVLLWIDDLQWGDLDSVRILQGWLRERSTAPVLFLFSYRSSEVATSACLKHLLETQDAFQTVEVEALPPDDTRALCRHVLGQTAVHQPELIEHITREAEGSPFLALQLAGLAGAQLARGNVDVQTISLGNFVDRIDAMLSAHGRELLQVLSVAGRPMPPKFALRAAGLKRGGRKLVHELRGLNLVRTRLVEGEQLIELYHDRVRETVYGRIGKPRLQELHGALFSALEFSGRADPDWLHQLALGAGRTREAVFHGLAAAEQAMKTLAFERAASLYGDCLELCDETAENIAQLWEKLAMAFGCCGRGGDAGDAFAECAKRVPSANSVHFKRLAASHYLRAGRFADGDALLTEVLEKIGVSVPETAAGFIAAILWERCRTYPLDLWMKSAAPRDQSPELVQRMDIINFIRAELWAFNPLKAAFLQARALRWAVEAGDPQQIANSLCLEAAVVATEGSERASRRAHELLERAAGLAGPFDAEVTHNAHAITAVRCSRAVVAWMLGNSAQCIELAHEAEKQLRGQHQDERAYFLRFAVTAVRVGATCDLGRYGVFVQEVDAAVKDARATDNQMALLQFGFNETRADAVRGVPEASFARLEAQRRILPRQGGMLRALHMLAVAYVACATRRYDWGLELFDEDWQVYVDSPMARTAYLGLLARWSRVRLLLNSAVASGATTNVGKLVKADMAAIQRLSLPARSPVFRSFQARIAAIGGNVRGAIDEIAEAVREYEAIGRLGEAACARYALGRWLSGEQGAAHCEASLSFLAQQGVKNPRAFVEAEYPEAAR